MIFKEWKLKIQKLMYHGGYGVDAISQVNDDTLDEYWHDKYERNITCKEALDEYHDDCADGP